MGNVFGIVRWLDIVITIGPRDIGVMGNASGIVRWLDIVITIGPRDIGLRHQSLPQLT